MHLRAVSASVIQKAGKNTPALVAEGLELVRRQRLGPAQLLLQTAEDQRLRVREKLGFAVSNLTVQHPDSLVWGGPEPRLDRIFGSSLKSTNSGSVPFTDFVVRLGNREKALEFLGGSQSAVVPTLLRCRALTNTVISPRRPPVRARRLTRPRQSPVFCSKTDS